MKNAMASIISPPYCGEVAHSHSPHDPLHENYSGGNLIYRLLCACPLLQVICRPRIQNLDFAHQDVQNRSHLLPYLSLHQPVPDPKLILPGLVRFHPKSNPSTILIGEPVNPTLDVGLAIRQGNDIPVALFSGSSVLSPGSKTGTTESIARLLSPLAQNEVGSIRCIGLNVIHIY